MLSRTLKAGLFFLLAAPLAAPAFEAVDTLPPATGGRFPAYPADEIPLHGLWVQYGAMYDSNILRRPTGNNQEFVQRLGGGADYTQRIIGRQTLHAEGRVDGYAYYQFPDLDNVGYSGLGEWRWELGNDLAGVIAASRRKFQASLTEIQRAAVDPITETRYRATGGWLLGPSMRVRGGLEHVDYERPAFRIAELSANAAYTGVDYVSALGNTVGLEYRETRGDAPVNQLIDPLGIFVNNDFRQRDLMLTGAWIFSPQLRLGGRVGHTERHYTQLPGRDFNGPTYRVALDWLPGYKTVLTLETYKEISSIIDIASTHVVIKGVAFGPGWAPTAKLSFTARVFRNHQVFSGDPGVVLGATPQHEEIVRGMRLGAFWEYTRHIDWTFSIDHGERESNIIGRNFTYNAIIGNVRYTF
jgi:hypothetical protein